MKWINSRVAELGNTDFPFLTNMAQLKLHEKRPNQYKLL